MECNKALFFISLALFLQCVASDANYDQFIGFTTCFESSTNKTTILYTSTDASYLNILQTYIRNERFNRTTTPKPRIIVTPTDETHVQATVLCAWKVGIQIKIRSGGHDYDGLSYVSDIPYVVLDMFNLRSITIDSATDTAWVQAGATLGELYYKISSVNNLRAFPAGVCPTLGVGGHISGGGYGNMLRKYGLSVDNVVDAVIIDVNGKVLDRKAMGEDLFWAIRGGGGASFGVILAYKIKLVPVPAVVTVFKVNKLLEENATDIVYRWQNVSSTIDNDLFIRLLIQPVPSKTSNGTKTIDVAFIGMFLGDSKRLLGVMDTGFPELGLKQKDCLEMSWIDSLLFWANYDAGKPDALLERNHGPINFLKRKSDYVQTPIPKDGLELLWKKMIELGNVVLLFNPYGGKMSEIPATATPFPHRAGNLFKIQYSVNWKEEDLESDKNYVTQTRTLYSFMEPYVSKSPRGAFLNYRDIDIGTTSNGKNTYEEGKVYGTKYFLGNFDRLVMVKTLVDRNNFFSYEQSIPPLPYKHITVAKSKFGN